MNYEIRQETITSQYAKELLELNYNGQRNVSRRKVEEYAADMRAGLWDENVFEPVHITKDMVLLNGQHRLQAVILADVPVKMFICYGGEEQQYKYIDGGTQRTVAEAIKAPSATEAASVARCIFCLTHGATISEALSGKLPRALRDASAAKGRRTSQCSPSRGEIICFYEDNAELIDSLVRQGQHFFKALKTGNKTMFAVFIWIARQCYLEIPCKDFLADMEAVPHTTAASQVTLRTLVNLKVSARTSGGNSRVNQMGTLLRGLEAYIPNQNIKVIKNQPVVCERWTARLKAAMSS